MNKPPVGSGGCCLPSAQGLTYLKVGPERHVVGMMSLETVFQQLFAMGRQPEEATNEELVGMARKFNYISRKPTIEADYAIALRQAYAAFFKSQEKQMPNLKRKSE